MLKILISKIPSGSLGSGEDVANCVAFLASDMSKTELLDLALSREGVFVMPNTRRFISAAHTNEDLEESVLALDAACRAITSG